MNANNDKGATNVERATPVAINTPAALLPCSCGKHAHVVTRDVEPQDDPWYGKRMETFVLCECGMCLFDGEFHEGFSSDADAAEAWNRHASTAPVASESRGSVPDGLPERRDILDRDDLRRTEYGHGYDAGWNACRDAMLAASPTPPAVASGEPTAEQWKEAFRRWVKTDGSLQSVVVPDYAFAWIEQCASELCSEEHKRARSAAAKGEG